MSNLRPCVITIANRKGGVGKTTSALAIGTILAQRGFNTLLVDLDPQGNLTLSLGFKPHTLRMPSDGSYADDTFFTRNTYQTTTKNLDIIFPRSLIVNEEIQVKVNTGDNQYFLSQELSAILTLPYDYVLIDCPPTIGAIMISSLLLSNFLIIPTQPDFYSEYAIKDMMDLVSKARREGDLDLPYRILITLFDRRNKTHQSFRTKPGYTFAGALFHTMIEADKEIYKPAIFGFPKKNTSGVKQYRTLVDELLQEIRLNWG